jgi:hypothetical protein
MICPAVSDELVIPVATPDNGTIFTTKGLAFVAISPLFNYIKTKNFPMLYLSEAYKPGIPDYSQTPSYHRYGEEGSPKI